MSISVLYQVDQLTASDGAPPATRLRQAGIEGLELRLGQPIVSGVSVEQVFAAVDCLASEVSMTVQAIDVACELTPGEGLCGTLAELLAGCGARGIKQLSLAFAASTAPAPKPLPRAGYSPAINTAYATLRDLRHSVEASGTLLTLDAGRNGLFLSPVEMRDVIDAANSWAIGACLDLALVSCFSRPADWVTTLGRRLHAVRLEVGSLPDTPISLTAEDRSWLTFLERERPINESDSHPSALAAALHHIGFRGCVILRAAGAQGRMG